MMKREEFQKAVEGFKNRVPFQPFAVELDNGERLVVGEPKALTSFVGKATFFHPDGNFDFVDSEDVRRLVELVDKISA